MADKNKTLVISSYEDHIKVFDALSHPMRIRIMDILDGGQQYVSELARTLKISRPLLYMHLKKIEAAGLVESHTEISSSGKANKYYRSRDYRIVIEPALIRVLAGQIPEEDSEE